MKKILITAGILLAAVVITLAIRTVTYGFGSERKNTAAAPAITARPSDAALERFAGGLRIPTVSSQDYDDTDFRPFDEFIVYLHESYPRIYENMETSTVGKYGLLFRWKGRDDSLQPVLFLSHYDVVPVTGYDPSTDTGKETVFRPDDTPLPPISAVAETWDYPPFSGAVAEGRIYGRGSLDMKCMLFALLESADSLISEGFRPERDIWFAFGHDEEVSGRNGALRMAEYFKDRGIRFDAVYDEGGIIAAPGSAMESIDSPLALVGTGEKGFLTLEIEVKGLGGHSSMPPAKSSLVYAAEIIEKLNSNQMKARIIPPVASFLKNIGGETGLVSRTAIANRWLLGGILKQTLSKSPASNALIRTTTAITMAKGSDAANVLSSSAVVTVNFRILPGDTVADVMEHVREICAGYDTEITVVSQREASAVSPENTIGFEMIRECLTTLYPDVITTSYITVGGTDAYKYQNVSDNIYRFMPIELNGYEQRAIHSENEYISIENYGRMIDYFTDMMSRY